MSIPPKKLSLALWHERYASPHMPMSCAEMVARGWDEVDIVFVTGDAYIDHPSFAMAILGRTLEAAGFRVAILSQPDWRTVDPWRQFGKPRLFFGVSAGNMDSMINHYTANKKVRNDDAYSPGGRIGLRPDRATMPYSQRCREAYPGVPVIAGGVEASLRRLAHFDYWSDTVKRAIMLDAKCDMVAYGMGEKTIVELAQRMKNGETIQQLRGMRGMAFALGAKDKLEDLPPLDEPTPTEGAGAAGRPAPERPSPVSNRDILPLPSYEEVKADKAVFAETTRLIHLNNSPFNARTLVQYHDQQAVVINPPAFPLTQEQMDALYDLPYTRRPHPSYHEPIPAQEMIKDSVTIMRGCFGGCTFCSITAHQGRVVQSRSKESVLKELNKMASDPDFKGTVSDIGGPTANMYQMRCTRPEVEAKCKRLSCVHPSICKLLGTDHGPLVELMKESRDIPGIRKVLVASGVRMDLAQLSPSYMKELAGHHVGGLLKVAPEHVDPDVLAVQKKPDINNFDKFASDFKKASEKGGKPKQYLVPYFISAHPGSDLKAMINLALYLKHNGYKPDQVQDFIPAPFDIATCMYYTGLDPFTKQPVHVARDLKNRKMQRALMQFFKPENYFEVRKALVEAGRADLIGGCDGLIGANPPKEALDDRRQRANQGDHYHSVANPAKGEKPGERNMPNQGYRPGRKSAKRR
ncbi:MAG: YgiQ family radical SAM protein [Gemmatales bacterium]